MASNFVDSDASAPIQSLSPRPAVSSPRAIKRTFSNKSGSGHDGSGSLTGSAPKCVCAPATHPNSFKCRLHRAPPGQSPPVSNPVPDPVSKTAHRTVEAQ